MTIEGAIVQLQELIDNDEIPFWVKPALQKVRETVIMENVKKNVQKENPFTLSHEQEIQLLFKTPYEKLDKFWHEFMENVEEKSQKKEHDEVIVVQIDCLMPMENVIAFRKELLDQMKEGLVIIPPWAHVAYVGDECTVEIKELKEEEHAEKL